jgi:hypothetical protein
VGVSRKAKILRCNPFQNFPGITSEYDHQLSAKKPV